MDMEHSLIVARDEAAQAIAKNLLRVGDSIDKVVAATGLTHTEVEALLNTEQ
jgi:hypothetical protein